MKRTHKKTAIRKITNIATMEKKKPRGYSISYLLEALEELRKENVDLSYLAKRD